MAGITNGGRQPVQPAPVTQTAAVKPFSPPRYHKRRPSTRSAGPGNANGGRQAVQPAPVTQTAAVKPFSRPRYRKRRPSTRSAGPGNANGGRQPAQPAAVSFHQPSQIKNRPEGRFSMFNSISRDSTFLRISGNKRLRRFLP